jgi:hypothetical protein
MTSIASQDDGTEYRESSLLFFNSRVLRALRIQVAILNVRSSFGSSNELEPLFIEVESLLRDIVREAAAA